MRHKVGNLGSKLGPCCQPQPKTFRLRFFFGAVLGLCGAMWGNLEPAKFPSGGASKTDPPKSCA